jgi:hypothetical protein
VHASHFFDLLLRSRVGTPAYNTAILDEHRRLTSGAISPAC